MFNKNILITTLCCILMLSSVILLDAIEVKMCKSFSFYRIFTMNSTVCTNITTAINCIEKMFTTVLITL